MTKAPQRTAREIRHETREGRVSKSRATARAWLQARGEELKARVPFAATLQRTFRALTLENLADAQVDLSRIVAAMGRLRRNARVACHASLVDECNATTRFMEDSMELLLHAEVYLRSAVEDHGAEYMDGADTPVDKALAHASECVEAIAVRAQIPLPPISSQVTLVSLPC
jgi:hypothetical protein